MNVDYDYLPQSNENWTAIAMMHLLIKCLAQTKI